MWGKKRKGINFRGKQDVRGYYFREKKRVRNFVGRVVIRQTSSLQVDK